MINIIITIINVAYNYGLLFIINVFLLFIDLITIKP